MCQALCQTFRINTAKDQHGPIPQELMFLAGLKFS